MLKEIQKIWILTEEYNLYDQEGAYYVKAWNHKPSIEEISIVIGGNLEEANHILSGGGRRNWEQHWYNLITEDCIG